MTVKQELQAIYPLRELPRGGWFFIPTLVPETYIDEIERKARLYGVDVRVYPAIHNKLYGVACVRKK
jgi:hypothetical protein